MRMTLKFTIVWMMVSMAVINVPCNAATLYAQADLLDTKTRHKPEVLSAPEQEIPPAEVENTEKKGSSKWVWIGLGVLVAAAAALAIGGSSGGGDDGDGTGAATITW